jgi:PAS domain S-box-containing protein
MNQDSNVQAPTFVAPLSKEAQQAVQSRGNPNSLNLDDIFGECFFTPDGDAVFLSDIGQDSYYNVQASGEQTVTEHASRPTNGQNYAPVAVAGGITTTGLDQAPGFAKSTTMGPNQVGAQTVTMPMQAPPQQKHHMQFGLIQPTSPQKKRTSSASSRERKMNEQQKSERRERNREHAKRSRIRKKFLLESLQQSVAALKEENQKLSEAIRSHLGNEEADELLKQENLAKMATESSGLIASNSKDANKVLDDPDFSFIKALQTAQQNFVVTDPSLPDNPIVYATQGFLNLTGYTLDQVLGRNCRFLQGPETDPKAVEKIRRSIEEGTDMSVCLLNYRVDGTTFWNQFFIAALRDAAGNITNYVGVQCKVSDQYAASVCKKQDEEFSKQELKAKEEVAAGGEYDQ